MPADEYIQIKCAIKKMQWIIENIILIKHLQMNQVLTLNNL